MPGGIPGRVGKKTDLGWEIWPRGLRDIVMDGRVRPPDRDHRERLLVPDGPDAAGRIETRHVDYKILAELAQAIQEGADARVPRGH
jgi:hypothetical protein